MTRARWILAPGLALIALLAAATLTPARAQALDPVARGLAAKALGQSFTLPYTGNCASVASACFSLQNPSGTTVFSVDKSGVIKIPAAAYLGSTTANAKFGFINDNIPALMGPVGDLRFNTDGSAGFGSNVRLYGDAANVFSQRFGVNPQTFRIYNTFTDASNGEWAELTWLSNVVYLRPEANGTGTVRPLVPVTGATTVAGLPSAATAGRGARSMVTDATACTFAAAPTGGGSTVCPVYSDGTGWKEG